MKNLKSFLQQCIAEVIVEPTRRVKPVAINKMKSFIKMCIAEVIVESPPRKTKVYGNPKRLQMARLIKECIIEVLKENLLENLDPQSQGPNPAQDNPYPEWNDKMRKLEEDKPQKGDSWTRYEKGYKAGQVTKRTGQKATPSDAVASVGYHDALAGKEISTPETVNKTIKEKTIKEDGDTIYKDREGGQWVYWMDNRDTGGKIRINPANVEKYLKRGYRLVTAEPWNDPKAVAGLRKENEHGRYAQQSGAGQFDPRTFGNLEEDGNDQEAVITRVKKEVYAALEPQGFEPHGEEPRDYVEFYMNGFVTVQVSVGYDSGAARVERYYDSEMVNNMPGHNVVKSFPVPVPYNSTFVQKFIKYAIALKRSGVGDEAIFGGIDDIDESRRNQSETIRWKCPHCHKITNIPIEIESQFDYIACADCEHCGKEISDPRLDQKVYSVVINHYAVQPDPSRDAPTKKKKLRGKKKV